MSKKCLINKNIKVVFLFVTQVLVYKETSVLGV
jgi:hypothetical protein